MLTPGTHSWKTDPTEIFWIQQPRFHTVLFMRGSRKFCQRGTNSDNIFICWRGDPNSTKSGPSSARQLGSFVIFQGGGGGGPTLVRNPILLWFFWGGGADQCHMLVMRVNIKGITTTLALSSIVLSGILLSVRTKFCQPPPPKKKKKKNTPKKKKKKTTTENENKC